MFNYYEFPMSVSSWQQLQQLILSASAYMSRIETLSARAADSTLSSALECMQVAATLLEDSALPLIKKLFLLRFAKDTLLLASLPFYLAVVVKMLPWISGLIKATLSGDRAEKAGKWLCGDKKMTASDLTVCKTILQLTDEILRWFGSTIREHPFARIKFRSAFAVLLSKSAPSQLLRMTELTFFRPDDSSKYQAYYIQRQSSEAEPQRLSEYLRIAVHQNRPDLCRLVQTGDSWIIQEIVEEAEAMLQAASRDPSQIEGAARLIMMLSSLFAVGEVEFCNRYRTQLLQSMAFAVQAIQANNQANLAKSCCGLVAGCRQLNKKWGMPDDTFREWIKLIEKEGIVCEAKEIQQYKCSLEFVQDINKDKSEQIRKDETSAAQKISLAKFIPVFQSKPPPSQQHSRQSQKRNFLEAYSRAPQLRDNVSEMKEIQLQHSNLSERFQPQTPKDPLLMSFKREKPPAQPVLTITSPQMAFSDSFRSDPLPPQQSSSSELLYDNTLRKESRHSKPEEKDIQQYQYDDYQFGNQQSSSKQEQSGRGQNSKRKESGLNSGRWGKGSESDQQSGNSHSRRQKASSLSRKGSFKNSLRSMGQPSALSQSRSANVLIFPDTHRQKSSVPQVQRILVEKTVHKPKFGFNQSEEEEIHSERMESSTGNDESASLPMLDPTLSEQSIGSAPSNFADLLAVRPAEVRINAFSNQARQLQAGINKLRSRKQQIVQAVEEKEKVIAQLTKQMPLPREQLEFENKRLKQAAQPKRNQQLVQLPRQPRSQRTPQPINIVPLKAQIVRQLQYGKCRLLKSDALEVGFANSDQQLTLYLRFLQAVEECSIRVDPGSLQLSEQIDAKVYTLAAGRQVKFKAKVIGMQLYGRQCQLGRLFIGLKGAGKNGQLTAALPFHKFNLIQWSAPTGKNLTAISDWHYCSTALIEHPHYLQELLLGGKQIGGGFGVVGQQRQDRAQVKVIVEGQKFAIQFSEGEFDLILVRVLLGILSLAPEDTLRNKK